MDEKFKISRNQFLASNPILYVTRVVGLAPFSLSKSPKGMEYILQYSLSYAVYSYLLCSCLVFLSLFGMIEDLNVRPMSKAIRMKNSTSRIVTGCDIIFIIFSASICIYGAPFRVKKIIKIFAILQEVDSIIQLNDYMTARKRSIKILSIVFTISASILSIDLASWNRRVTQWGSNERLFKCYAAFYFFYLIIIGLECQYWHAAYSITRRFKRLNQRLHATIVKQQNAYFNNQSIAITNDSRNIMQGNYRIARKTDIDLKRRKNSVDYYSELTIVQPKYVGNVIDLLAVTKAEKYGDGKTEERPGKEKYNADAEYIKHLCTVQDKLCECIRLVNECYGLPILVIIMSCMLHLIVTPYFLLMELMNPKDILFLMVQIMWIVAHSARLLILILPCYATIYESKNTGPLVCRFLNDNVGKEVRRQIAGAVTTYLVILMQFQRT